MNRSIALLGLLLTALICTSLLHANNRPDPATPNAATPAPATQPAAEPKKPEPQQPAGDDEPIITRMRVQDFPAIHYCYISGETTLEEIGAYAHATATKAYQEAKENEVSITGPLEFIYKGVTQDRAKPFTLEIGFPVAEGTKEAGDLKVRDVEAFHCATVIYSGPITQVGLAYQQLYTDLFAAGLQPTGESRDMYLYFESPESPNNVELIMVGVR